MKIHRFLCRHVCLLAGVLGAVPVAALGQIADAAAAVPVHFQGMFDAQPTGDPDLPAYVNIFPLGVTGASGAAYGESSGGSDQMTGGGFARLRPGKTYLFEIGTGAATRLRVKVTGPAGHRVFINRVEHEIFDWAMGDGGPLDAQGFFSVRLDDGGGAPVGQADSLRPGRLLWSLGLGSLRNGNPAGNLRLVDDGLTANAFRPAGLYFDRDGANQNGCYSGDDGEVIVVKVAGVLRQVYATTVLADIVTDSDHAYLIRLFPREAVGEQDAQGIFAVSSVPLHEFRIENPAPPALDAIRISRKTEQNGSLTMWTQMTKQGGQPTGTTSWLVDDWVEKPTGATVVVSPVRHRWMYSDSDRNELFEISDATSTAAHRTFKRYTDVGFGVETTRELEYEIAGYGGLAPVQTNYTYHTNFAAAGNWHKIRSITMTGGAWTAFDYHDDFRTRGQLRQTRRPHRNNPASDPGYDAPLGEVTTMTYAYTDNFGTQRLPTKLETKIDGLVTARTEFSYAEESIFDRSSTYSEPGLGELPILVTERRDYFNATQFLTLKSRTYREDADPQYKYFPGLLRSIERPDQTMTVAVYFRASFMQASNPFYPNQSGGARVRVTLHGTSDTTTGIALADYNSASQPLPANFRLVSGKSTLAQVLLAENALPLLSEQQAFLGNWIVTGQDWPTYINFIWPANTQRRTAAAGPTWSIADHTWVAGRLTATVDEAGIRQTYRYDSLGRVEEITREGATANGVTIAAQTIVHAHDAAGRLQSSGLSAGGESLVTATAYDLAGRVTSESAPGRGPTMFSYLPESRMTTATQPTGATRIETRLSDGRLASVEGSAVVAEYYQYDIEPDGRRKTTSRPRSISDVRKQEAWADWLNRPLQRSRSGFNNQTTVTESMTYHPVTGQRIAASRTGYADIRYEYNSMGEMIRSGIDLNGDGLLPASSDRITDFDQSVESYGGSHWLTRRTWAFHQHQLDARILTGVTRQRLTGLSAVLRAEARARDPEDNETTRTVTVDAASKLVTVATTAPGLASPGTEVSLAGFAIASTGHDGLVYRSSYDALGRLRSVMDPRTGTAATASITYLPNSTLPDERRDASNRLISKTTYDEAGRPKFSIDGGNRTLRTSYNSRGQVLNRWGSATYPVSYIYDAYGQRIQQRTYRDPAGSVPNFWESAAWPGDAVPAQIVEWEFDDYSGQLRRKYDPERKFVEYTYNSRGQIQQRVWSRTVNGQRVTTSYDYFTGTGEPRSISYNDGTPQVSFQAPAGESYSRLGQPLFVNDATGSRDFVYEPTAPWRLATEALSSFYGNRQLANLYESVTLQDTGTAGYTGHTLGSVRGRSAGFRVGLKPSAVTYDFEVTYGASNTARFAGVVAKRSSGSASRQFVYGYEPTATGPAATLVKTLAVVGNAFQVSRTFESNRDLATKIDSLWNGVSRVRYDYTYDPVRQRETAVQTGEAFADLGATHQRFTYDPRGELTSARWYPSTDPAGTTGPLPGRFHDYDYDAIGNRRWSNTSSDAMLRDDYTVNDRNQYTQRENNTLTVGGTVTANSAARIAVSGSPPLPPTGGQVVTGRSGNFWGTNLVVANQNAPFNGSVSAYAVLPGAGANGTDLVRQETTSGFLPPVAQFFSHDEDGNLKSDGLWDYAWDAENRLTSMSATPAAVAVGRPPLTVLFRYDYRHRRVKKEVRTGANFTLLSERRYLYDGWSVIAELDGGAGIKRSFTWGLDLNGGVGSAGGVGGLLQIHDVEQNKTLFPAYDGNGNIAALLNADTGALEASYEYSPFGELLRATGAYAKANPFRFSTKWQDDESGLICHGYRYYSAREGRFINRDPIEEQGGLNLYGFCGNDGINTWDYLGQSWLSTLWNKFRHTIISAALYAIPGAGPVLATLYNVGVGARYGGVQGALLALAGSGRLGGFLNVTSNGYGLYATFKRGKALNNFGNWFLGSALANASYQLADFTFNGPPSFPAPVDLGDEAAMDPSHLLERIGTFDSREMLNDFASNKGNLDQYGSGFFAAIKEGQNWTLFRTDGIYTNLVYVNGIQGLLGRHASLGIAHLGARFLSLKQFTVAHNRSHGFFMDILEVGGDLLGIPSKSAIKLASALQNRLSAGDKVSLVSHSQGFATTISAMRILAIKDVNASGLTVYPHAGAGNSFHAATLATALDAKLMPHVFSSFDLVPGLVGMNGNPLQVSTGMVGFRSLFGEESESAHTLPNGSRNLPWLPWGPGN